MKPGKTLDDVARLDREAKRLFAEIGLELSLMRLSPLFNHAMQGQPGADYIDITMGSLKAFGTGWDNWMASKDALKLMVAQNNLAICTFKFARESNRVAKTDALDASDNRLISMNWCSKRDNVSWSQLKAKHDA